MSCFHPITLFNFLLDTNSHLQFLHGHQFLAVSQFHLFNRSLARSCIDAGQWNPAFRILHPPSESCIPHHCPCYCDGEKRKETKDSCVRHRRTIQGSCYVFVVILVRCHSFKIPARFKIPSLIKVIEFTLSHHLYVRLVTSHHSNMRIYNQTPITNTEME